MMIRGFATTLSLPRRAGYLHLDNNLSFVIPAERRQAREPGPKNPCLALVSDAGVHGSRIGSLALEARREPSGMTAAGLG
jgi:hypothetical protein